VLRNLGDQQMTAAEHVERQVASTVAVIAENCPPPRRVSDQIEIENDLPQYALLRPTNRSTGRFLIATGSRQFSLTRRPSSAASRSPRTNGTFYCATIISACSKDSGQSARPPMSALDADPGYYRARFELRGQAPKRAPCSATSSGPIPRQR
jgi:hypothetical protein